jgi:hypothetical protein
MRAYRPSLWIKMSMRYKEAVFARDGSEYEGGSQELTVLHSILQY